MFHTGQRVICIEAFTDATEKFHLRIPKKHEICTVSSVNQHPYFGACLEMEEYPPLPGTTGDQFASCHFRPLEAFPAREEFQEVREGIEREQVQTV